MTKLQAEIIVALADNSMNVSHTAKKIFMSRSAVNYHLRRIRQTTGKNPTDFYDMRDLLPVAQDILHGAEI